MPTETEAASKPKHYKELLTWQRGMKLAKEIYRLTAGFPAEEKFGLTDHMRRAAVSVPSNIAEVQARHQGVRGKFLSLASGSLAELETQLSRVSQRCSSRRPSLNRHHHRRAS